MAQRDNNTRDDFLKSELDQMEAEIAAMPAPQPRREPEIPFMDRPCYACGASRRICCC